MEIKDLQQYKHGLPSLKPDYYKTPITVFNLNPEGIKTFNAIYKLVRDNNFHKFELTPRNYIPKFTTGKWLLPAYCIHHDSNGVVELIVMDDGVWRFQCRGGVNKDDEKRICGRQAFNRLKKKLQSNGIDLNDYIIENGKEVKETIEPPLIKMDSQLYKDIVFDNCHHIDFHSSYPAGLVNTHPEFKDTIQYFYDKRKDDPMNKAVLNLSIGYMQSISCCGAKWAHLSKDAIEDNNKRVREMAQRLKIFGNLILSYNTDGIWYSGDIYHGEGEGSNLGDWSNDHINCKFRMKSAGSYEFIENGKCHVVVRGHTHLDEIKPRDQWIWGDIYRIEAEAVKYEYDENVGIVEVKDGE